MGEVVMRVVRTVGVRWPAGWQVGVGDLLVLKDGQVDRVVAQPTTPGQVYGDLLQLLNDDALAPLSHPRAAVTARLQAVAPDAPPAPPLPPAALRLVR